MRVHQGFDHWMGTTRTVATLGNYDGVHSGHQVILRRTLEVAQAHSSPVVVVTFDPVPRKVLSPETAPPLIQTITQRLARLESFGVDHVVIVRFDQEFARKSPEEFVRELLVGRLAIRVFVVGEHFSFGHQRTGNVSLLKKMGLKHDFEVEGIPELFSSGVRISSTYIREKVLAGDMEGACEALGGPFCLTGKVVQGEGLGGRLGIPTANLSVFNELLPAKGVYVTSVRVESQLYPSVTNVGVRPSFGGTALTVESHLIDFSGDLYGKTIDLQFLQKLRDERRFDNIEELKAQIQSDIDQARQYFEKH